MKGSVKKRGSSWTVVYDTGRDPVTGKRIQKKKSGFKTKKDAERYLVERINELEKGTFFEPSKMTVSEYLDFWLDNHVETNTAPKTVEGYRHIVTHIKPILGAIELAKLQPLHLQSYYSQKLSSGRKDGLGGLSKRTVGHHHRLISKALNDAVKWQLLPRNVAFSANPPKAQDHEMMTLSAEEVNVLLTVASPSPVYPVIYTAIHTGMRRGEVLGLRWKDVNFNTNTISVRQTLQNVTGKGIIFKDTKSKKGRPVAMTASLVELLLAHKEQQFKYKELLGPGYQDKDLVFAKPDGSPIHPTRLTASYNELVKKAGVTKVRFHDLRHTHATLMLENGIHPKVVSERLGHSKVGITLDTYSHVMPSIQKEAADLLDLTLSNAKIGTSNPVTNL